MVHVRPILPAADQLAQIASLSLRESLSLNLTVKTNDGNSVVPKNPEYVGSVFLNCASFSILRGTRKGRASLAPDRLASAVYVS